MTSNTPLPLKDQKGKPNLLLEVIITERQLWALIQSKGLLCFDVKELYRKVCSSYEKIILGDYDVAELQDVEYSLWKLHYKHIDEFRKRIKRSSGNSDENNLRMLQSSAKEQKINDNHIKGFRVFLLESIEYYQKLIVKMRDFCGCSDDSSFYKGSDNLFSIQPKKLEKCQFLCHRFLVCLGDLARYKEQYEKFGAQEHNWSVAATHYFEASLVWPDSGNPQNQLAVLATYVGDDFLALYHCIRSLAVKEPFPDAWNNLILLFERNRSLDLHSLSKDAQFDFLKPSESIDIQIKPKSGCDKLNCKMSKTERNCCTETNLWSLIIRTVGFFFINSSLEDFPCAFASTMRELDMMMTLDDANLKTVLESYQRMDLARTGPFRALQVVSIFIFIIHNSISKPEPKASKDKNEMSQQIEMTQLALTATFIFMGRFLKRCLRSNPLHSSPLLPAVLVFVEWLVCVLDEVEKHMDSEKINCAVRYFFGVFVGLLKQLNPIIEGSSSSERTTLWEDHELRGFAPVSCSQESLNFSSRFVNVKSFESGSQFRVHRIISAAMKISNRSNGNRKWILYEETGKTFHVADSDVNSDKSKSEGEEEEVIVFKPLTRYNSAPLTSVNTKDADSSLKEIEEQSVPPEERLRRATSLLIAQKRRQGDDPSALDSDISNFHPSKPYYNKQQEKDTGTQPYLPSPLSSGPPSLSAWVFDQESMVSDREKLESTTTKPSLSTIEENPSSSLSSLSISGTDDSTIHSDHSHPTSCHSLPYTPPEPSAPLLPDNATWLNGMQPSFSDFSCPNWAATHGRPSYGDSAIPGFNDRYVPFSGMSSSEWLRQYRETHNLDRVNTDHAFPLNFHAPRNFGGLYGHDSSNFYPYAPRQPPLAANNMIYSESPPLLPVLPQVHVADEQRRDSRLFHVYQRPIPYNCGNVTELKDEPQPLLQYLKEKEWLLQRDPTLRGPTFTGK